MTRRPAAHVVAALALCGLLAACGSTVQQQALDPSAQAAATGPGAGVGGDGLSVPGTGGAGLPSGTVVAGGPGATAGSRPAAGAPGAASGTTGTTGGAAGTGGSAEGAGAAAGSAAGAPGQPGAPAPGAPAGPDGSAGAAAGEPIQLGAVTFPDLAAFFAAFGGDGSETFDQNGMVRHIIEWINANGGVGGRPVEVVISEVSLTSTTPYAQLAAEICAEWTEDNDVLAGIFVGSVPNDLPACLSDRGRVLVTHGHYMHDDVDFAEMPFLLAPTEIGSHRLARALATEIAARGGADVGDTVGLLTYDYPAAVRGADILEAALTARGAAVVRSVIRSPQSTPDIANSVSQVQAAQLRMAALGADTVTFLCAGCDGFFMQAAASQAYYPTYALSSLDGLGTVQSTATPEQLEGAYGISWEPLTDIGTYSNPDTFTNSTRQLCGEIMARFITDDTTEFVAHALCDSLLYIKAAGDAGGADDGAAIRAGAYALADSWPSAMTFGTRTTPDRHDGVTGYRMMAYDAALGRMAYTGTELTPAS